jgi:hypothetical protein
MELSPFRRTTVECEVVGDGVGTQVTRGALRRYFPNGRWAGRVQPLPDHGVVFVKNAKAGTSTVLLWMHRIHTGDHEFTPEGNIHGVHALPAPADVGWNRVARMLDGEAFRFSFVRDPIRRLESAYLTKIVHARHDRLWRRTRLQQTLGLPEDPVQVPTLDQFVAALEAQDPIRMDPHWRPQHLNLMHPLITYDALGRVETFSADLARIREMAGLPDVPVEAQNVRVERDSSLFDGRRDLLRRVREVYACDLELYGY